MVERPLQTGEYLLVPLGVVVGALLVYDVPFAGLPLSAFVYARLVFAGSNTLALVTAVLATIASAVFGFARPMMVGPTVGVLIWAVGAMKRRAAWRVFAAITLVAFVSFVAAVALGAMMQETTPAAMIGAEVDLLMEQFDSVFGAPDAAVEIQAGYEDLRATVEVVLGQVWWAINLVAIMLGAAIATLTMSRLALLHGIATKGPRPLPAIDLPYHVVWPLALGFGLSAWALYADAEASIPAALGYSLLLVGTAFVATQGLAVAEATMRRFRMGIVLRLLAYGLLFWLGGLLPLLAIVGTADLWINFRKLPRGTDRPEERTQEDPAEDAEEPPDGGVE
jgi:hypothetical protein